MTPEFSKYELVFQTFNRVISLTDLEKEKLSTMAHTMDLPKGMGFLSIGQPADRIGFINSGVLEMYTVNPEGNEVSIDFLFEGEFVTDYVSYLKNASASIGIRTIQKSSLLYFLKTDLDVLFESNMKFQKLGRVLAEESFVTFAERIRDGFLPPEERYQTILKKKPHWIQHIPLYKIASYLNISPEWLSKLRAKI